MDKQPPTELTEDVLWLRLGQLGYFSDDNGKDSVLVAIADGRLEQVICARVRNKTLTFSQYAAALYGSPSNKKAKGDR